MEDYFAALREGRLLIKNCRACGKNHFYPRSGCPFCFADGAVWHESGGVGTIYSFSVLRKAGESSVLAYVTLEEGPTMMTSIVDCPVDDISIGQTVRLEMRKGADGSMAPMFTPI
ncbi:Zn-ribbon domain-containing OB-fold protein [Tardiphaga sp. 367_B4_N1_1]|uniref:Zn-ribbon domain-containing OB-fold protein n=1 Tax=Tardiphaga sp. 367_B4_N1_1 TaxID=3240777 RepID=UPI003F240CBB